MRVLDLSHPIVKGMPVYPGTPAVEVEPLAMMEANGFRETLLTLSSHTGTHVDAPAHMIVMGKRLDDYGPESFTGFARCLKVDAAGVTVSLLEKELPGTPDCDFILFQTGWDQYWGGEDYFRDYPVIDAEAAAWLARLGLKGIGLDTPSPDSMDSSDYPAHLALMEAGMLILENLKGLARLPDGEFRLVALPLPIAGGDGAPARIIALQGFE